MYFFQTIYSRLAKRSLEIDELICKRLWDLLKELPQEKFEQELATLLDHYLSCLNSFLSKKMKEETDTVGVLSLSIDQETAMTKEEQLKFIKKIHK